MSVISLGGTSELVLLGLVERAEAVLHAQAERLSDTNRRLEATAAAARSASGSTRECFATLPHWAHLKGKRFVRMDVRETSNGKQLATQLHHDSKKPSNDIRIGVGK
jgi:hypothetical protein